MSDPVVAVTNADIDEALRQLREEAHGHEPYGPSVYPRAVQVAHDRMEESARICATQYCEDRDLANEPHPDEAEGTKGV